MKILLEKSTLDINELKELKQNHKITFNPNEPNIDLVINDTTIYFKNYKDYSVEYKHWIGQTTLSFIVGCLEDNLLELNYMNF